MDATELIATTACASFVTDSNGRIVAMNEAAEEVLGRTADEMVGEVCHDVIRGKDVFGNRFCDGICTIHAMVRRKEPIHHFQMIMEHASGKPVQIAMCTMVIRSEDDSGYQVIHLLQPTDALLAHMGLTPARGERAAESPDGAPGLSTSFPQGGGGLTSREMEVLGLLKDGVPTQSIADALSISVTTVRNHIQGILRKLGAHSRLEAVSVARRRGII